MELVSYIVELKRFIGRIGSAFIHQAQKESLVMHKVMHAKVRTNKGYKARLHHSAKAESLGNGAHKVGEKFKSKTEPVPVGSTLLIDFANLIGGIKSINAADLMERMERGLNDAGYNVLFFVERRTLDWACYNQVMQEDGARFRGLCSQKDNVLVINGKDAESDQAILDIASAVSGSFCVSRDKFRNYAAIFPTIVGSQRVRTFNVIHRKGLPYLRVDGLCKPILLKTGRRGSTKGTMLAKSAPYYMETEVGKAGPANDGKSIDIRDVKKKTPTAHSNAISSAIRMPHKAEKRDSAIRVLGKAAKKNPSNFYALADIYSQGSESDCKLAAKYEMLGQKQEKRLRESHLRDIRRYAQMRRMGYYGNAHLSARRRRAKMQG